MHVDIETEKFTTKDNLHIVIERFATECCKTQKRVITLANQDGHKQCNEPIRTQSIHVHVKPVKTRVTESCLDLVCFSMVEKLMQILLTNHRV